MELKDNEASDDELRNLVESDDESLTDLSGSRRKKLVVLSGLIGLVLVFIVAFSSFLEPSTSTEVEINSKQRQNITEVFSEPSNMDAALGKDSRDKSSVLPSHQEPAEQPRPSNMSGDITADPSIRPLSALSKQQAENYRNGTGLILNVHITHHGGTTFCGVVGKLSSGGKAPSFACIGTRETNVTDDYPRDHPWKAEDTSRNVAIVRRYFHMIQWEYGKRTTRPHLQETDWENPNLFSVYITRDPISRLLAGDGYTQKHFPGLLDGKGNITQLWGYARDRQTNNYALRVLAGDGCCRGNETEAKHVEAAKELVRRFSVVIDISCLNESLELLAKDVWNITLGPMKKPKTKKLGIRDILWDDEVYDYLVEKNKRDIELYEWTKTQAYLDCSRLPKSD